MELIADTSLLIGLWRRQAWAVSFASSNASKTLGIPWVVLGEFWHGATRANHDSQLVKDFLSIGIPLLDPEPVVPVYAKICATMQDSSAYEAIGQNDLWIAACAVCLDRPLITRNLRHFGGIPGLRVEVIG